MQRTSRSEPRPGAPAPPRQGETPEADAYAPPATERPTEVGGPRGPEPTRYGDWERAGRCIDF